MAITNSTARADIFKEWYAVIKDNLNTSGVKITNAFVDDTTQIPQVVVHAPALPRNRARFGTSEFAYDRDGEIEVEVYGNTMQQLVELVDDVENAVFSNLTDLSVNNVQVGESDDGSFELEGKTVRVMILPFSFQFKR